MAASEHPIVEAVKKDPVVKAAIETDASNSRTTVTQSGETVAMPTTTEEEDRGSAGQRNINVMWEGTQRVIAIGFAYGSILLCFYIIILGPQELQMAALTYILTMGATVNQSYFTRTNHTKVGGVKYEGR